MEQSRIRLLRADEIECRVSVLKESGLSLLLYKDARVDQKILDETFGAFGWKRSHQSIEGNLYCTVEIFDKEKQCWIGKQDVGTTGYAEKEKSQASDSFKRACFNWGIGRELYSAPFIWVPAGKANIKQDKGKPYCNDRFSVAAIGYNEDREIVSLSVVNGQGETVYELGGQDAAEAISEKQMHSLEAELQRTGVGMDAVKERYQIEQPEQMSAETYRKVMAALKRTKSAA
jgi:hypothetical protein